MAKSRVAAALLLVLVLGFLIARQAFVQAYAKSDPGRAALLWPGHPDVILEAGLVEVGDIAASGRPVDGALVDRLVSTSIKAPLAPEPFLVKGVASRLSGDEALAGSAFQEAMVRNPRAVAARYFLADHYVRTNQTAEGLAEISALARLVPRSLPRFAPYLAAYAARPDAAPQVKAMIRREPQLESALLTELAAKAGNANLLLYLWSGRGGEGAAGWQTRLLNSLVEAGQYDRARIAWSRFTGISSQPDQLFDPEFSSGTPPPFGWTLVSGPGGVAEPEGRGRLHIIYYGRDSLVLASQHLTLPPARYVLSMRLEGAKPSSGSLAWKITCLPSTREIALIGLDRGAKTGGIAATFNVPTPGCPAQRLELAATAPELPEQADLTISGLRLGPETAR